MSSQSSTTTRLTGGILAVAVVALIATLLVPTAPADAARRTGNPATPGNFTGYGFDQCIAPPPVLGLYGTVRQNIVEVLPTPVRRSLSTFKARLTELARSVDITGPRVGS